METYEGNGAEIVLDGDTLVLTRKGMLAKVSGLTGTRRIPLRAITDVRFKEAGRITQGWLHLVIANEPPGKADPQNPNVVYFAPTSREQFSALHDFLLGVIERNRELGVDPAAVPVDNGPAKEPGWLDRVNQRLSDNLEGKSDKHRARLAQDLWEAGISRQDVIDAAMAMGSIAGMPSRLPEVVKRLRPDETVRRMARYFLARQDEGGIVVLTDARLMILGSELWSGNRTDELALRLIASVGVETGMFGDNDVKIYAMSGHSVHLERVSGAEEFADAIRDEVGRATAPAPQPQQPVPAAVPAPDVLDQLTRLGQLRDAGVLTTEEFEAKKAQLLDRL